MIMLGLGIKVGIVLGRVGYIFILIRIEWIEGSGSWVFRIFVGGVKVVEEWEIGLVLVIIIFYL